MEMEDKTYILSSSWPIQVWTNMFLYYEVIRNKDKEPIIYVSHVQYFEV